MEQPSSGLTMFFISLRRYIRRMYHQKLPPVEIYIMGDAMSARKWAGTLALGIFIALSQYEAHVYHV